MQTHLDPQWVRVRLLFRGGGITPSKSKHYRTKSKSVCQVAELVEAPRAPYLVSSFRSIPNNTIPSNMNSTVTNARRWMRRVFPGAVILLLFLFMSKPAMAQKMAVKTNFLHDITTTANLGAEFRLAPRWTFDLSGDLNPWTFSEGKRFKHWLLQPELRYWTCDAWSGHFFGAHLLGGQFNVGGFDINANFLGTDWRLIKDHRYQGWMAGAGLAYGYAWILGQHWNLEAEAGAGWVHSWYDTFRCAGCGKKISSDDQHDYFGVTKLSVSLVYLF